MWACFRCGREFKRMPERLTCVCGYRIFRKPRPEGVVRVVRTLMYCRKCGVYRPGPHPHTAGGGRVS